MTNSSSMYYHCSAWGGGLLLPITIHIKNNKMKVGSLTTSTILQYYLPTNAMIIPSTLKPSSHTFSNLHSRAYNFWIFTLAHWIPDSWEITLVWDQILSIGSLCVPPHDLSTDIDSKWEWLNYKRWHLQFD